MTDQAIKLLEKSIRAGRLGHAYLFIGPVYVDKLARAREVADLLNCHLPDLIIVEPLVIEKGSGDKEGTVGIEQIQALRSWASLSAYHGGSKLAIINRAERLTSEAANALLKTLEEPASQTIFILLATNAKIILSTLVSRCQLIKLASPSLDVFFNQPEQIEKINLALQELNKLRGANLKVRFDWAKESAKNTGLTRSLLNLWLIIFRKALLSVAGCSTSNPIKNYSLSQLKNIIKKIEQVNKLLTNSSISANLALETLMLEL